MKSITPVSISQPTSSVYAIPDNITATAPVNDTPDSPIITLSGDIREFQAPRDDIESLSLPKQALLWILHAPEPFFNAFQDIAVQQINNNMKEMRGKVQDIKLELIKHNDADQVGDLIDTILDYHAAQDEGTDSELIQLLSDKCDTLMLSMKMSTGTMRFLQLVKGATGIRTPLLIQQFALGAVLPEIPGVSSKVGLQFHTLFPSRTLCKCLTDVQMNLETHIQAFAHLETGWAPGIGEAIKGGAYVGNIEHVGFDYKVYEGGVGMLPFSLDNLCIAFESVQRAEVFLSANQSLGNFQVNEQFTLGGDYVEQELYKCSPSGLFAAGGRVTIQGVAAAATAGTVAGGMTQSVVGAASIPLALASAVFGCCFGGKVASKLKLFPPTKSVTIVELCTVGFDGGLTTSMPVAGGLNLGVRGLHRLNASDVIVEDNTLLLTKDEHGESAANGAVAIEDGLDTNRNAIPVLPSSPQPTEKTPETLVRHRNRSNTASSINANSINSAYSSMRSKKNNNTRSEIPNFEIVNNSK
ncbi:hypothetical protein [Glaciimonas immobilis]|uniref:Uncharacterized protein n=1 Tax=Glaciimonas immobilis TaxID=728004 RepID=A0A840RP78_9BURK|nr:hypothetical protein [Glaciimonas immobilis]KAF3999324.1 hypothetical protein HAV38_05180 [Glaciimonas immobilis]MBB5198806.1 hypothetical protein [Glaciimonas immobilis]